MPPIFAPVSLEIWVSNRLSDMFSKKSAVILSFRICRISCHVLCGSLRFRAYPLGSQQCYAIGLAEVLEGIMSGDDLAAGLRNRRELGSHLGVQLVNLAEIGLAVRPVRLGTGRIGRGEPGHDVFT